MIHIKWFPRSWIQLKTTNHIVYIDPSYVSTYFKRYDKKIIYSDAEDDALPDDLEKGDLVLISHIHKDHCKEVTINRISDDNTIILTPKKFSETITKNVKLITPESKYLYKNIEIEIVPAYNTAEGSSVKKVHKKGECVGFIINIENKRIYFSGDTDVIPEMRNMKDIDIAMVPIGGTFTMNIEEAMEAVLVIKPKVVIPVHHLKADPMEFKLRLERSDIDVIVLNIGDEIKI
jgi:L-ascorbate metabolism protein UlaG (beta-lactamase superfamily)